VGGIPDPNLTVVPDTEAQRVAISGSGFELALAGSDRDGATQSLGGTGSLCVPVSGALQLQGQGFAPESSLQVFLDPIVSETGVAARIATRLVRPTTHLGGITTDEQGRLESDVAMPDGVEPGDRVLQLVGQTSSGSDVVLTIGITIESASEDAPTIAISAERGKGRDARRIYVTGTTTGLIGEAVTAWVRAAGKRSYARAKAQTIVAADGTFTWRKTTAKRVLIYFTNESGIRSETIRVKARPRR
jgi:hypothetical protein